jgi:hypothetical protein
MPPLASSLRNNLERSIIKAREEAVKAAETSLKTLVVGPSRIVSSLKVGVKKEQKKAG